MQKRKKKIVNLLKIQNFSNSHEFCSESLIDWLIDRSVG